MKASEIREMTTEEMLRKVTELKTGAVQLRFQHEIGQLENQAKIRQTRQDIARLLTVSREVSLNPPSVKA